LKRAERVLYFVRVCLQLKDDINENNLVYPQQKMQFYDARGLLNAVSARVKKELDLAQWDDLVTKLDKTMDTLHALSVASGGRGWITVAEVKPARAAELVPEVREFMEKAVELLYPGYLAFRYYVPIPNLISLVLALAFALTTEYFSKTFGTQSDYIAAFAWGLGVDTATKTIPAILAGLGLSKS